MQIHLSRNAKLINSADACFVLPTQSKPDTGACFGNRRSRPTRSSLECVHTSEGFNIDQQVWASNPAGTIYDPPLRLEVWGAICRSRIRSPVIDVRANEGTVPQSCFFLAPHECAQLVCVDLDRTMGGKLNHQNLSNPPHPIAHYLRHTHTQLVHDQDLGQRDDDDVQKNLDELQVVAVIIYILGIYVCIYPKPAWPTTSVCFRGHKKSCGVVLAAYMATSTRLLQSNLPWRSWGKVCGPIVGTSFVTGNFGCRIGSDQIRNCLRQLATVKRKDCDFKLWNWSSYAKVTRGQSHVSPSLLPSLSGCIVGPSQLCQLLNIDWCLGLGSLLRT